MRGPWLVLLALVATASAHEHHVTLAEVRHAPDEGVFQVVLDIDTADLELELAARADAVPPLESDAADTAIVALLEDHFVIRQPDGESAAIVWLGKEIGPVESTLYFTVDASNGLDGLDLEQTLGLALHARQVNTVNVHVGGQMQSLVFTREARVHTLVSSD